MQKIYEVEGEALIGGRRFTMRFLSGRFGWRGFIAMQLACLAYYIAGRYQADFIERPEVDVPRETPEGV